jgi:hypothetical protein
MKHPPVETAQLQCSLLTELSSLVQPSPTTIFVL